MGQLLVVPKAGGTSLFDQVDEYRVLRPWGCSLYGPRHIAAGSPGGLAAETRTDAPGWAPASAAALGSRGSGTRRLDIATLRSVLDRLLARGPHTRTRPGVIGAGAAGRRRTDACAILSAMINRIISFSNTLTTSIAGVLESRIWVRGSGAGGQATGWMPPVPRLKPVGSRLYIPLIGSQVNSRVGSRRLFSPPPRARSSGGGLRSRPGDPAGHGSGSSSGTRGRESSAIMGPCGLSADL